MTPDGAEAALAAIVRLDILPRLIGAAPDPAAGALATELIASGKDKNLPPLLRSLVFIPLLHGDRPIDRERAVALFAGLRRETQDPVFEELHAFALQRRAALDP
ncbi:DUF924 family protein [Thauera propionica]|jgi:uncharacterized protein (DUF924 family)|uniref:DUF924 family protein n=1 Tax=Thauera propionica TaxID=2019431 RepID=UPI0023F17198|nr:DUF924 family protein [Thauera propionica]MDD3677448.1 DUF924 family protein [Thauera propionica]